MTIEQAKKLLKKQGYKTNSETDEIYTIKKCVGEYEDFIQMVTFDNKNGNVIFRTNKKGTINFSHMGFETHIRQKDLVAIALMSKAIKEERIAKNERCKVDKNNN